MAKKAFETDYRGIELLAPAGDMAKLKLALCYGADAVYAGGKVFGLRAMAGNFDIEEMRSAIKFVHATGKKFYVTVNVYARSNEFEELKKYVKSLETVGVDAVIVSDLGVLSVVRENTNLEIHISTQANIVNKYTAAEFVKLGASRVILARELSVDEIKDIATHLRGKAEVEVFVHGAMCISYSGRCVLSNYLTGRDSNRGACAQPCRWKYALMEEKRPGKYLPIAEDERGTYIMNSKDLCLVEHLDELAAAGVTSFKIEGRMKSDYYVAGAVNTYRRAMNGEKFDYVKELEKLSHRKFTTGFAFPETTNTQFRRNPNKGCSRVNPHNDDLQFREHAAPVQTHEFVAMALENGQIEQRNGFAVGDTLEILSPTETFNRTFTVTEITNLRGESLERAKNVQEILHISCPFELHAGDILRKRV